MDSRLSEDKAQERTMDDFENLRAPSVRLVNRLTELVARAAQAILPFDSRCVERRVKEDASPVTAADEAADAVIAEGLAQLLPGVPVVSEEGKRPAGALGATFILVDPLDGTREFLAARAEYTVNLAIIVEGRPTLGIVAAPALKLLWRGGRGVPAVRLALPSGEPGAREAIVTRKRLDNFTALVSRSHLDAQSAAFLAKLSVAEQVPCGSSLKFCRIAEGAADLYPRLAPTSEWDIAAGDAVLTAAGGIVLGLDGAQLRYGNAASSFCVPGFIAWGDAGASKLHLR